MKSHPNSLPYHLQTLFEIIDWRDNRSILEFIRKYQRPDGTSPDKLVNPFGGSFPLCNREITFNTLWNGTSGRNGILSRFHSNTSDRTSYPLPFLACGPGTGKNRFLEEVARLLAARASESDNESVKMAFSNIVVVNTTFGNGTSASKFDVEIGGEAALAVRLIYQHFISCNNPKISFADFIMNGNVSLLCLTTAINIVLSEMTSNIHVFVLGPMEELVQESTYLLLQLPLPLLPDKDMLFIASSLGFPNEYILKNNVFRCCLAGIGGMARVMEFFFRLIIQQQTHNENDLEITDKTPINLLNRVDIVEVMTKLMIDLTEKYPFKTYSQFAMPMLANAILEKSVMESDGFNIIRQEDTKYKEYFATYKEIKSAGIINLESADNGTGIWYKIRLPYLWLCIVVSVTSANSPIKK
ncbi:9482_t:CDS:2 [Entrophospora sp. SA101]|nr:9482_t:CDS:2 [Entrophospora sp. SA101]CAJ0842699.1 8188_t:CDS:2 [Entrophospora sp. SA101]